MEEKLFRGQRADTKKWVEGDYIASDFISPWRNGELYMKTGYADGMEWGEGCFYRIIPKSVSQYTGVDDKHGKKIWEGINCRVTRTCILSYGHIIFENGAYWFKDKHTDNMIALHDLKVKNYEIEVLEA